ncbi:MAG TPA: hypothetical protein V6D29_25895 [Leptolyngbyaceae cyanobacterium]
MAALIDLLHAAAADVATAIGAGLTTDYDVRFVEVPKLNCQNVQAQ